MKRIQLLRACIGVYCNGKIFGCSINGVKQECQACEHSHGGQCQIKATTGNVTHAFCKRCFKVAMKRRKYQNEIAEREARRAI